MIEGCQCFEGELHDFRPRYDEYNKEDCQEHESKKIYILDICIKCGTRIFRENH